MSVFAAKVYTITEYERREIADALAHAAQCIGPSDSWNYDVVHTAREILNALPNRIADTEDKLIEYLKADQAKYLEGNYGGSSVHSRRSGGTGCADGASSSNRPADR